MNSDDSLSLTIPADDSSARVTLKFGSTPIDKGNAKIYPESFNDVARSHDTNWQQKRARSPIAIDREAMPLPFYPGLPEKESTFSRIVLDLTSVRTRYKAERKRETSQRGTMVKQEEEIPAAKRRRVGRPEEMRWIGGNQPTKKDDLCLNKHVMLSEDQHPFDKYPGGRHPTNRYPDSRCSDPIYSDSRYPDRRLLDPKYHDPRHHDPRHHDPRHSDPGHGSDRGSIGDYHMAYY